MDTTPTPGAPEIRRFHDYRQYLKALYQHRKSTQKNFSFQYVSKKLGVTPSYLKHVIEERRHIGLDRIMELADVFKLNELERDYFSFLVLRGISKDDRFREFLGSVLGSLQYLDDSKDSKFNQVRDEAGQYLVKSWLAQTIFELMRFPDFRSDPEWIRERLLDRDRVSSAEIEEILNRFLELGLVEVSAKEGRWRILREMESLASPFSDQSLKPYQFAAAKTFDVLERGATTYASAFFFTGAYAVDAAGEDRMIKAFRKYRDSVAEISKECETPDRVVYVSNNIFNLAKKPKKTS